MGDVFEYIVDGTSGIAPGGVEGKALIAGVCSKGQVGKGYLVGKRSDLRDMLGTGPLVDRLRDIIGTGGQNPVLIAVPVQSHPGGYISPPLAEGTAVQARASGVPGSNADIVVRVHTPGAIGISKLEISIDGGTTYSAPLASAEQLPLNSGMHGSTETITGAVLQLSPSAVLEAGATYSLTVRTAIGPVIRIGGKPDSLIPTVTGDVLTSAELTVQIVNSGGLNAGTYQLSTDGGDTFGKIRTIPVDGVVSLPELGVTVTFPAGAYSGDTTYTCRLLPPITTITDVMTALSTPLAIYDVEFVHVVGPSDSVDWAAAAAKTEELWNGHRPTYVKMESRLPYDGEELKDWVAYLLAEKQTFAARWVQVCCQFGEVSDVTGQRRLRNWAGLQAGRTISIPVQRATGRVRDGNIVQGFLPDGWDAVQPVLEEAGYLTAKKYAGLSGAYWGDSRTMADDTSDYRYEEVVRVAHKSVRKLRVAALKSMYDEAGDPLRQKSDGGLAYLKANLENALATMTTAVPPELAAYSISIPPVLDIVNNGVAVEVTLIGIPVIRQIKIYAQYVYAGSKFDPRIKESA